MLKNLLSVCCSIYLPTHLPTYSHTNFKPSLHSSCEVYMLIFKYLEIFMNRSSIKVSKIQLNIVLYWSQTSLCNLCFEEGVALSQVISNKITKNTSIVYWTLRVSSVALVWSWLLYIMKKIVVCNLKICRMVL